MTKTLYCMDINKDDYCAYRALMTDAHRKLQLHRRCVDGIDMLVNMIYGESNRVLRCEMTIELLYELLMDSSLDSDVVSLLELLARRIDEKIDIWSEYLLKKNNNINNHLKTD